ncbi:conserved hypothetical protein [Hyella patelloides LEGE 07179]|uniref:Uncharacterized protein n=1 Tax=Hyella patelloides LEGE 07179 TaxID=945734 RepID=A0A563VT30_9CYAN|nr:hypothetical protein [Hyella patelloides]VEP14575.1 conserved hypothetical protein [Hyella patelloides LEGE 07179]
MLPEKKHITNKNHQQKSKFVTVIHPEKLTAITTAENDNLTKNTALLDRDSLVSWLFLIGSLMFLFDGLIELTEGISIHVFLHLPASVVFVVGSYLFMPTDENS